MAYMKIAAVVMMFALVLESVKLWVSCYWLRDELDNVIELAENVALACIGLAVIYL